MKPIALALISAAFFTGTATMAPAWAQDARPFRATVTGHAFLPAESFVPAPADAPAMLKTSGKFTGPARNDKLRSVEGVSALSDKAAPRKIGISLPFEGQPVQGFSGIRSLGNGEFMVVTDNGFGSKANSPDAMLMFHRLKIDFVGGQIQRQETLFLHDPDKKVPFLIVNEGTDKRYLTGADFDLESMQPVGDTIWFGEEFGPYLIATDRQGKVKQIVETKVNGKPVRSPDHYAVRTPGAPGAVAFESRRSKGYEGMAASKDGKFLYPLLEGALWDAAANGTEKGADGKEYLRILEFDLAKTDWTGRSWKYRLEVNGNSIGDFNMIDANSGMIIERDDTEGSQAQACKGEVKPDCFNKPAKFKRVYKIDLSQADADGYVKKVGYIDLMDMADPNRKAKQGGEAGEGGQRLTFPFFTIENVDVVDATHIIVGNDNNLPFSSGRKLGKSDDNEFVLLEVKDFLAAK
ncbi:MAG: esterase-like activity of phytase family protein [Ferrovibrio sp.]|uniref:esterase-like activity of phytase family protein n=1 Tax=Ferrovibrio sp. TaxID=1917215 RepID=UPI00260E946C|nr:esterase-like activity of phytase family protein [Ferrovibrio sp.]MCW0236220.1 esterase-like activity of phytase family protein [Ferrovibrio sp.]